MAKVTNTPNRNDRPNKNKKPHVFDIKPESDYKKGAHDEVGEDIRKSRQQAIDFQENEAEEK